MPSTMAIAARYWMKTTGAVVLRSMEWGIQTENTRDPAGETQTLEPRPRPATWVVAVSVKPSGRLVKSFIFLFASACCEDNNWKEELTFPALYLYS